MYHFSWDSRDPVKPVQRVQAHQGEINSVAFHPNKEWMLATGSSDKVCGGGDDVISGLYF